MDPDDYPLPQETGLRKHQVESIAEDVARQLGVEPGADLTEPLEGIGGRIRYEEFGDLLESDSGSLFVHGEENFEIVLSRNTSQARDRFTVAHELGHYVLHFLYPRQQTGQPEHLRAMRYGSDRSEWEANWFAAAFLMPRVAFETALNDSGGAIWLIAQTFAVSESAAHIRGKSLNLL